MKKVTLSDIAHETGYSVNTVSHALHDKSDISEETKEIIRQTAKNLGYIGNSSARSLRSGKSKSIAFIVSDISNPYFSIRIKEIENWLRGTGYTVFVLNTDEDEETEKNAIIQALEKNVDGILICPVQKSEDNIVFLEKAKVPFVLLDRRFPNRDWDYVVCDDEHSGYIAAKELIKMGHRKILFLNGPAHISSSRERSAGIQKAFSEYTNPDLSLAEHTVSATFLQEEQALESILMEHSACTAIITFSDMIALQVCHVIKRMGQSVPEDVSVIGFDNIASKFYLPLMISSTSSTKTSMSVTAVDILIRKINGDNTGTHRIVLPTELVLRESTSEV